MGIRQVRLIDPWNRILRDPTGDAALGKIDPAPAIRR